MKNLKMAMLASAAAIALLSSPAGADVPGTSVTQSATHADAASFWVGQANGLTACNAVSQTSASQTVTITPPAGQYVYLTALLIQKNTDATGVTEVPTISTTNISSNGGATAGALSAASTLSTTGNTNNTNVVIPFQVGGLRSAAPGVAVTLVPSAAQATHGILCMSALGFYNAN